jgi:hypothetical protein
MALIKDDYERYTQNQSLPPTAHMTDVIAKTLKFYSLCIFFTITSPGESRVEHESIRMLLG